MLDFFIGVTLAAGIIWWCGRTGNGAPFILGLFFLPGLYVAMSLMSDAPGAVILREIFWGLPYFAAGAIVLRYQSRPRGPVRPTGSASTSALVGVAVGILWLTHAAYDLFHHHLVINTGVPPWYPGLCVGFDAVFGLYLIGASYSVKKSD